MSFLSDRFFRSFFFSLPKDPRLPHSVLDPLIFALIFRPQSYRKFMNNFISLYSRFNSHSFVLSFSIPPPTSPPIKVLFTSLSAPFTIFILTIFLFISFSHSPSKNNSKTPPPAFSIFPLALILLIMLILSFPILFH